MNSFFRSVTILASAMIATFAARAATPARTRPRSGRWPRGKRRPGAGMTPRPTPRCSLRTATSSMWSAGGGKGARSWRASSRRRSALCSRRARSRSARWRCDSCPRTSPWPMCAGRWSARRRPRAFQSLARAFKRLSSRNERALADLGVSEHPQCPGTAVPGGTRSPAGGDTIARNVHVTREIMAQTRSQRSVR